VIRALVVLGLLIVGTDFLDAQEIVGSDQTGQIPRKVEYSEIEFARLKLNEILRNRTYLTNDGLAEGNIYSELLSESDRYSLYKKYEVSGLWGLLNFPYGIGSFVQGDPTTSLIYYAGLFGGSILVVSGGSAYSYEGSQVGFGVMITGDIIAAAALIFGQARPWFFANEVNTNLKGTLLLPKDMNSK